MFVSLFRLHRFSLAALCLWLLLISGAITTTQAQARGYVADACNNTVDVIDTRTNTFVAMIPVGVSPRFVDVSPDAKRVYVSNQSSNSVSVIDTATNTVISTIPINFPNGIAISSDSSRVYVANGNSAISVIDASTNTVIDSIPASFAPYELALTKDGTRLYVTHGVLTLSNRMSVIDIASHSEIAIISIRAPAGIDMSPDGTRAYVTGREPGGGGVIDTATNTLLHFLPTNVALDIALTPDGTRGYVPNYFGPVVQVYEIATNTVIADIPVSDRAMFVAITPDGTRAYVSVGGSSSLTGAVAVIDTATNVVVDEIEGFMCPQAIAIAPPQFPRSKDDCKDGGYQRFGSPEFRNQGQCLKYVKEHSS